MPVPFRTYAELSVVVARAAKLIDGLRIFFFSPSSQNLVQVQAVVAMRQEVASS